MIDFERFEARRRFGGILQEMMVHAPASMLNHFSYSMAVAMSVDLGIHHADRIQRELHAEREWKRQQQDQSSRRKGR